MGRRRVCVPTRSAIHSVLLRKHRTYSLTPTWPPAPKKKHVVPRLGCALDRRSATRAAFRVSYPHKQKSLPASYEQLHGNWIKSADCETAGFEGDEGAVNCICQKIV